jgi:glutamyl-Q tRNA(Asp) synthetase
MPQPAFRFAPSPNGNLHLGHALSALINAAMAGATGGRLLLRIEDIDETRCKPEYEAAIYEDLAWLGVTWEEPVRRQSEHYEEYKAALARLDELGLIYPSFESRAFIPAMSSRCPRRNARGACRASPMRYGSTWRRR